MQCKNCGRDVKSDYKYCPYCANRLIHDFEDHFSDLNPPYVMPDLAEQESDDAAFLYGRARVIPDEKDEFFFDEPPGLPTEQPDDLPPVKQDRSRPYEVYRPASIGGTPPEAFEMPVHAVQPPEDFHVNLPDALPDFPDVPPQKFAPSESHASAYEAFHVNLPDALPDLPDVPPQEFAPSESHASAYEAFHVNLPDALPDLPDVPPQEFAPKDNRFTARPSGRLEWEAQDSDKAASGSVHQLEDAPYVTMQPDIGTEKHAPSERVAPDPGPGILIKVLLIFFMISLGALAAFVLYRFGGGLFHVAEQLKLGTFAIGCILGI